jgi:23S rRNA pseudouridine2605 synthase
VRERGTHDRADRNAHDGASEARPAARGPRHGGARPFRKPSARGERSRKPGAEPAEDGLIRLNRYLAQSGVASRREADELIKAGVVTVNGVVVTELGTKVHAGDKVHYGGQRLSMEKPRYVLLNKPKGFITTTDDPKDRRTVMQLVAAACPERLYPVGRLDRNTTGLLLMTNDGDLAKKLTHPSHGAEKIYHATLDKAVSKAHLQQLVDGVELEDGMAQADEASFVEGSTRKEVGLKLHMGRNRIVRRMFEALGYEVLKLDRVVFAGLTKKEIPRGTWRMLTDREVVLLKQRK